MEELAFMLAGILGIAVVVLICLLVAAKKRLRPGDLDNWPDFPCLPPPLPNHDGGTVRTRIDDMREWFDLDAGIGDPPPPQGPCSPRIAEIKDRLYQDLATAADKNNASLELCVCTFVAWNTAKQAHAKAEAGLCDSTPGDPGAVELWQRACDELEHGLATT